MKTIREVAVEEGRADPAALEGIDGGLAGSFSRGTFLAQNVQNRITSLLVARLFEDAGLDVSDEDRAITRQQLEPAIPGFTELEESERDRIVEEEAKFQALQREMCPDFVPSQGQTMCPEMLSTIQDLYESTDIDVSSKLGSWEKPGARLVPPEGPESQPRDGDAPDPDASPLGLPIG